MKFSWIVDIFMLGHTLKFGEICLRGCTVTPIITPSVGDPHLYPIHGSLDQPESYQKWHLGQVSHLSPADHILSLYFAMDQDMSPQNCPFPWGIQAFTLYMVPVAHPSPQHKRHLDQYSRFCRIHACVQLH